MSNINKLQKYSIDEPVIVQGWGGSSSGTVKNIDWMYHPRLYEYTWGYFIEWDEGKRNPFTFIPEGYLCKDEKQTNN